jgi:HPt (histidine-containing phosphotransfer) domain-containing protein
VNDPILDPDIIAGLRQLNQPGEPDMVQQVLTLFLEDATLRLDDIANAIDRRDGPALQRAAHTFKGAAASIGASRLQEPCRELELLGKNSTLDDAPRLLERVREEFARVRVEACAMIKPC